MLALIGCGEPGSSTRHLPSSGAKRKNQVAVPLDRLPRMGTPQRPVAEYHPAGQERDLDRQLEELERYGFCDHP